MEKTSNYKKFIISLIFVLIAVFLSYNFLLFNEGRLSVTGNTIIAEERPVVIITEVSTKVRNSNEDCFTFVSGEVVNLGDSSAINAIIKCRPAIYPIIDEDVKDNEVNYTFNNIESKSKNNFEITVNKICNKRLRFQCDINCDNC